MTPAQKAATALLDAKSLEEHPFYQSAMASNPDDFVRSEIPYSLRGATFYTQDDEAHDRDRLRQWLLACIGGRPTDLRTAIGEEALQLILKPLTADLEILSLQEAEKHLTRF